MTASADPTAPRLLTVGWQQLLPAARLLYVLFPPSGVTPVTWREVTDPDNLPDPMPFADEVAELFAAAGVVVDLVESAPPILDISIALPSLDACGEHLRVRALTQGRYAWDNTPTPAVFGPRDSGQLPDTCPWFALHREAKRPWIAAAAGILTAAGAQILAEHGEQG